MARLAFFVRRAAAFAGLLLGATVVLFLALEALPGDTALALLGTEARPDTLAALRRELGLDRPPLARYLGWLAELARGDLGESLSYRIPVADLVADRLAVTLPLTLLALVLAIAIGLPLGMLAAARQGRPADWAVVAASQLGLATPSFWIGILLILLFAVTLGWLPAGGFVPWSEGAWPALRSLILPAVALALPEAAILARVARGALLDTLSEDWVRTARAKGIDRGAVMRRHVLRNALIPVVTILGLQFAYLMGGAIVVENVFALPGLGQLLYQSVGQSDIVTLRSVVLILVAIVAAANLVVDLLYGIIDPRPGARR